VTTLISFDVLAKNVYNDLDAFGGSTQSAIVGVPTVTSGYAVSLPGHEQRVTLQVGWVGVRQAVADYAESKRSLLAQPGRYLGAWIEDGLVYLDITEVHAELATAVRLGWERDQLAIFDLGRGEEIRTRPGRRTTVTEAQTAADKLAHETGLVRDYFKRIGNTHGDIMASVTGPESPSPFEVVAGAIAELGEDGELRLVTEVS
jgi:hypothetical protein